jgi:hypothetical protein
VLHTFALQSIAGIALPAPEAFNAACGATVVADTIVLHDGNAGVRRTTMDVPSWDGAVNPVTCEPAASSPRERVVHSAAFTWRLTGEQIEIDFPCDDMASCIASPHLAGTMSETGLVLDNSRIGRSPLVYERVPFTRLTRLFSGR